MKTIFNFIILILFMILLSFQVQGQVNIKPETARYFLEADDERFKLREKDSISTELIGKLKHEIFLNEQIINTYRADAFIHNAEYNLLVEEYNKQIDELDQADETIFKEKRWKRTFAGAAGGALVGSTIGPVGSGIGLVVGGVTGFFIKKK